MSTGGSAFLSVPRGFTLIEAMIVIAILGILAALAGPSFVDMIKTARVRGAASDLYSSLLTARSEAIKRRKTMTITPAASWAGGWSVTFDNAGATATLVSHEALATDLAVRVNAAGNAAAAITYGSNGRITSATPTLIFYAPNAATVQARCVTTEPSGMPRLQVDSNGDATDACN
jgi:type IV fimbrial biogenesis protein FimT